MRTDISQDSERLRALCIPEGAQAWIVSEHPELVFWETDLARGWTHKNGLVRSTVLKYAISHSVLEQAIKDNAGPE